MEEVKQTHESICKSLSGSPSGRGCFPISRSRRYEQLISLIEKELLMSKRRVTGSVSTIQHEDSRSLTHDPVFNGSSLGLRYQAHTVTPFFFPLPIRHVVDRSVSSRRQSLFL